MSANGLGDCSTYKYLQLYDFPDMTEYVFYSSCACNEYHSLTNRHIRPPFPQYEQQSWSELSYLNTYETTLLPDYEKPLSASEVIKSKSGALRKRYAKAWYNTYSGRVTVGKIDSRIKSFVKQEKIKKEKYEEGKPARMIQYRDYKYLLLMNRYLKPIFTNIHNSKKLWFGQPLGEVIMSGYNSYETAAILRKSWDVVPDPVAVCLDAKFWDGSLSVEALLHEHKMWIGIIRNKKFRKLLRKQLRTIGRSKNGIKYRIKGTRLSGEYNTSYGNSKLQKDLLRHVVTKVLKIPNDNVRIHVIGDDNVVILSREYLDDLLAFRESGGFLKWGIEMKLEKIAYEFGQIEFCQQSPIIVKSGIDYCWRMVRNPYIIMSKMSYVLKQYWKCLDKYLSSTALCELALNTGVPITQQFSLYLMSKVRKIRPLFHFERHRASKEPTIVVESIDEITRTSVERAFAISIPEQLAYEKSWAGSIETHYHKLKAGISKFSNYHKLQQNA